MNSSTLRTSPFSTTYPDVLLPGDTLLLLLRDPKVSLAGPALGSRPSGMYLENLGGMYLENLGVMYLEKRGAKEAS